MDFTQFFDKANETTWRLNIRNEASSKFDSIVEFLTEHKENILSEIENDLKSIEEIKLEQKEEFTYSVFKKWLDYYTREVLADKITNE